MKLSLSDIKKVQKYFAEQKDVLAVYFYGSFAKGTAHKGSDIDIAVLFKGKVNLYKRLGSLYSGFPKLSISAEPEVREVDLDKDSVYLRNVVQGKLFYSNDEIKRIRFEVAAMQKFRDTEPLRKLSNYYMRKRLKEGTYGFGQHYTI